MHLKIILSLNLLSHPGIGSWVWVHGPRSCVSVRIFLESSVFSLDLESHLTGQQKMMEGVAGMMESWGLRQYAHLWGSRVGWRG